MNVGRGGFGAGGKSESGGSKDDDFTDEDDGEETDSGAGIGSGIGGIGGGGHDKKKIHVFQKKASTSQSSASDLTQVREGTGKFKKLKKDSTYIAKIRIIPYDISVLVCLSFC